MSLGIVCGCEGLLGRQGTFALCRSCHKAFPLDEVETVLKLLRKADYEPTSSEQSAPTEQEKRSALNIAARKLAKLGLRVMEVEEIPVPPPVPPRVWRQPVYTTTANTSGWVSNFSYVSVRVTIG